MYLSRVFITTVVRISRKNTGISGTSNPSQGMVSSVVPFVGIAATTTTGANVDDGIVVNRSLLCYV